jgi:hypothetical protein
MSATIMDRKEQPIMTPTKELDVAAGMISPVDSESLKEPRTQGKGDIYDDPAAAKFKSCSWWHAGFLMIAETISLGILSLPAAIAKLGLIPGILAIIGLGLLATYAGYIIFQWKLRYPQTMSFTEVGQVMGGKWLGVFFGTMAVLSFIFIMAAHILAFSVMMNVLTEHGLCSVVFGIIGTVVSIILSIPRTAKDMSKVSIASFLSILSAVMLVMIHLGIVRKGGVHVSIVREHAELAPAFIGVLNIMLAYAGNTAFFGFISELKNPRDFPKALVMLQSVAISIYVIVGVVIYYYVGNNVASPALTSAAPLVRKIAYGLAFITIVVAGVINGHVAAKQLFTQFWTWRGQVEVSYGSGVKSWISWIVLLVVMWIFAWFLAEVVPIFEQLLGLVSALFMSWFSYGLCGIMWIYMNKGMLTRDWKKISLLILNIVSFTTNQCRHNLTHPTGHDHHWCRFVWSWTILYWS